MRSDREVAVGCDLDGVIGDIVQQLVRFSRQQHGVFLTRKHITSENIETCTPLERGQLHGLFENREFFRTLPVIPRARQALSRLKAAGFTVHIVTDRFWYSGIHEDTTEWLKRHRIPFDSVAFARKIEKQDVAERLRLRYFIEDQLSNAKLLAPLCPVALLDRSYNQGQLPEQVTRVKNVVDAADLIIESATVGGRRLPADRLTARCLA
jgi:5'(3')-deoxyribonucleotidase